MSENILDTDVKSIKMMVRSANVLDELRVKTLGQLLEHNYEDLLMTEYGQQPAIHEISNILAHYHLRLPSESRAPYLKAPFPVHTYWGALLMNEPSLENAEATLRRVYGSHGLVGSVLESDLLNDVQPPFYSEQAPENADALPAAFTDDVVILLDDIPGWTAVLSQNLQFTAPQKNPLALALADLHEILTLQVLPKGSTEVCLYTSAGIRCAATGTFSTLFSAEHPLTGVDLKERFDTGISEAYWNAALAQPWSLAHLIGLGTCGFEEAEFEDALRLLRFSVPSS